MRKKLKLIKKINKKLNFIDFFYIFYVIIDYKGDTGCVMDDNAVQNYIQVDFSDIDKNDNYYGDCISVKIEDLIVVKDGNCSNDKILEAIPLNNRNWWCKVEDGYIYNLKSGL